MNVLEKSRFDTLTRLASKSYGDLGKDENGILELSVSTGEHSVTSSQSRPKVPAAFLRWLLTDKLALAHIDLLGPRAENVTISSDLVLDYLDLPFPLRFQYCTFEGKLFLQAAKLPSLNLWNCTFHGLVSLNGLKLDHDLGLGCARFAPRCNLPSSVGGPPTCDPQQPDSDGSDCITLVAAGAEIGGSLNLRNASSMGTIQLRGIRVGADFDGRNAKLSAHRCALDAEGARITLNVGLNQGFSSNALIRFTNAQVGGVFTCEGGTISKLQCDRIRISGALIWSGVKKDATTELDLQGATVGRFQDDRSSWPGSGNLHLDGFVYQDLDLYKDPPTQQLIDSFQLKGSPQPLSAKDRVDWLELQPPREADREQPWMQLAKVLEANGYPDGARWVKYRYKRRKAQKQHLPLQGMTFFFDRLEEQPFWVLPVILVLWLFGFVVFWRAKRMEAMIPKTKNGEAATRFEPVIPFNPAIYSLENVLPVVKLGQEDAWQPNPRSARQPWFPGANLKWTRWLPGLNYPWLAALRWALILLGWALAIILAAAISGQFKF